MNSRVTQTLRCGLLLFVACVCSFAQEKERVIEIPFDFWRNEILLQVKVDGKGPFNMMLDTGTDPSAVDLTTAKELGLKLQSLSARAGGGGTEARVIYGTRLPVVEVGRLPVVEVVEVGRLPVVVDVVGLVVGLVLVDVGLLAGLLVGLLVGRPVLVLPPPIVPPPLAGSCCALVMPAVANNRVVNTNRAIRGRRRRVCIDVLLRLRLRFFE